MPRNEKKSPKGIYKRGGVYWLCYFSNGQYVRESAGTKNLRKAEKILIIKRAQAIQGIQEPKAPKPFPFDSLVQGFLQDYELNRRGSTERARISAKYLGDFFEGFDAKDISTEKVHEYIQFRQSQRTRLGTPPAPGTINRELAALKRMLRIAAQSSPPKIQLVPYIPMMKEENVRTGFFEWDEVHSLLKFLPAYSRPVVLCAFFTGMRRGEILTLRWQNIDLDRGLIRLDPDRTKSGEGRTVYMSKVLKAEIENLKVNRDRFYPQCEWVFSRNGHPIKHIQRAWKTACRKAGLEGRHFHDLRRSGVRNLVRAGVPERVAMAISGHKTRSVFDRYNIVNEKDLEMAAKALDAFIPKK